MSASARRSHAMDFSKRSVANTSLRPERYPLATGVSALGEREQHFECRHTVLAATNRHLAPAQASDHVLDHRRHEAPRSTLTENASRVELLVATEGDTVTQRCPLDLKAEVIDHRDARPAMQSKREDGVVLDFLDL